MMFPGEIDEHLIPGFVFDMHAQFIRIPPASENASKTANTGNHRDAFGYTLPITVAALRPYA